MAKVTFLVVVFEHLILVKKLFLEDIQSKLTNNFLEFLAKLLKEDITSLKLEK